MLGLGNILTKGGAVLKFPNEYSFNLDGSNDYLLLPADDNFGANDTWSVSFWFKSNSISTTQALFSASKAPTATNRIGINLHGSVVRFSIYGTFDSTTEYRAKSSTSLSSDTWYHLVATNSNGTLGLYINNVEQTGGGGYGLSHSARRVIGSDINFGLPFNGLIDEFAIWDTVLSADDVAKIASKPVDFSKASTYATDRTSNLKLWLRAGDKVLPENDTAIARQDFYTDFDGTDDYVDCGDGSGLGFSGADAFSITAWVNPSSLSTNQIINAFGSDTSSSPEGKRTSLFINSSAKPALAFWGNDVISNGTVSTNKWVHLVTTFAGGNRTSANTKIYIDGVSQTLTGGTASALDLSDMDFFHIGADQINAQLFNGIISSTSIYKTVLDAQTISQMAKSRFTPVRNSRFSVVDFDGVNDYIDCGANVHDFSSGDFTISGWIFHDTSHDKHSGIVGVRDSSDTEVQFYIKYDDERLGSWNGSTNVYSTSALPNGWSHVAMVQSGSNKKFYINGVLDNTASQARGTASSATFKIGYTGHTSEYLLGSISSISVYNVEKSAEEIYAIYQQGITYDESSLSGLVGYWKMGDDTSASYPTIADSSSNSNDGTITNGASDDIVQQMVAGYDLGSFESSSEELSGEIVTNGSFDTDSDWGKGTGWSINATNGTAIADGTGGFTYLSQSNIFNDANALYKMTITIDSCEDFTQAGIVKNGSVSNFTGAFGISSIGTHTVSFTNSTANLLIYSNGVTTTISNISVKEVLQSEVSDSHPAIVDVTEPVLGVELVDDIASWNTASGITATITTSTNTVALESDNNNTNSVTAYMGTAGILNTNIPAGLHKISFTANWTNPPNIKSFRWYYTGSSFRTYTITEGLNTIYDVMETSNGNTHFSIQFTNENQNLTLSNISAKQIQGNVGTMTNQASSDLVYSSVLPDQSFLTGVNSAYNFIDLDGSNEYIDCGTSDSIEISGNMTIIAWINPTGTTSLAPIVFKRDAGGTNYQFYLSDDATPKLRFYDGSTVTTASSSLTKDSWQLVGISIDSGVTNGSIFYVNNSSDGTATFTISSDDANLLIGKNVTGGYHFEGGIGQVAIFNKNLSSTEISAIYTLGRHGNLLDSYSDNLVGYWAMSALDAKTGLSDVGNGTIYDRSGNSNHGTATSTESADLKSSPNAEPNGYAKGDTNRSTTTP